MSYNSECVIEVDCLTVNLDSKMQRDYTFQQYGLVFISSDNLEGGDNEKGGDNAKRKRKEGGEQNGTFGLVTPEAAQILEKHQGNLGGWYSCHPVH